MEMVKILNKVKEGAQNFKDTMLMLAIDFDSDVDDDNDPDWVESGFESVRTGSS